jgi:hypothetical protein
MVQGRNELNRQTIFAVLRNKKYQQGQATLEFTIIIPILFGILFLGLALAVGWHVHQLSASLSLEGSSLESYMQGYGLGFSTSTGNRVAPSSSLTSEVVDYPYAWLSGNGVRGQRFTIQGIVNLPWAPLEISLDAPLRGTTYTPVWEFNGAP